VIIFNLSRLKQCQSSIDEQARAHDKALQQSISLVRADHDRKADSERRNQEEKMADIAETVCRQLMQKESAQQQSPGVDSNKLDRLERVLIINGPS